MDQHAVTVPDALVVFVGHSDDASEEAKVICDLRSDLQKELDARLEVMEPEPPFKKVKVWEWRDDAKPIVGGQDKTIAPHLKEAHVAVFVFKERVGAVTWDELNEFRNRKDKLIPVIAAFPENPPGNDKMNNLEVVENWGNLLKRQKELTEDWNQAESRSITPIERYKDVAHLRQIILEQFKRVLGGMLKRHSEPDPIIEVAKRGIQSLEELRVTYEMTAKSRHPCFGANIGDLDWDLVQLFRKKEKSLSALELSKEQVVDELGLLSPLCNRPLLHNAAVLCFCKSPHRFVPQAVSKFIVGRPGDERIQLEEVTGPLSKQIEQLLSLTVKNLETLVQFGVGGRRSEEKEIPEKVVREAIANAIAHRNYDISGNVQVRLSEEYLEIQSPGSFPPNASWETLLQTGKISCPIDAAVSLYLTRLLTVEGIGRGFAVFREYLAHKGQDCITCEHPNKETVLVRMKRFRSDQPGAQPVQVPVPRGPSVDPSLEAAPSAAGRDVALSNLPERNPFFTGRERALAKLHEALAAQGRVALSGLGGVGKTQTAVEYAHRHLEEYDHVFWVSAASREALLSSYVTIAGLLKLSEVSAQDQTVAVEAVKRWLGSNQGWLLILDNADDIVMARAFLPSEKKGHVIFTTRAQATGATARRVEIQKMEIEEGVLFLLRRAMCIVGDAPLDSAAEADRVEAKAIAAQLDGLPLALDQAAAYIEETTCGFSRYLDLYRSHAPELLQRRGALPSDHPNPVGTTWVLSFENIEKANPAAAELLRFCAFLHPDKIPEEVFSEGAPELGPVLGAIASDPLTWNEALSEILKYSLLRRDPNTSTFDIHRLVQAVLKQVMDEANQRLWAERVVRAINLASPNVEFSTWPLCERLLPQAHACAELINQWGFEFPEAARLLNQAGVYLHERGRYTDAQLLYQRALAIWEKALGPEHLDVAQCLNNLGRLYYKQGPYAKAENLLERALTIREKVLGLEHPAVATSLNNLGRLSYKQGQYAKAEPLLKRALAIREKALGPEHPAVATSLNNLGMLYRTQGQHEKAELLFKRAAAIRERVLGREHPDVSNSLNNLAMLYCDQGQYAKAEPLFKRALTISEQVFGPKHPDLAWSLNSLAELYQVQGQYAKAEPLFKRALAIREKALGSEHPDLAWSLNSLGALCQTEEQYGKAEPLYQRALAIRESALGPKHPDLAWSLNSLGGLYRTQAQYDKAEPLFKRALAIQIKALGLEHPDVAKSMENYASLLRNMGRSQEAEPLEARARAIRAKIKSA